MTPNQGRGFFGEEIIKTINLINSQKLGQYLEQTPFGTHPSSSKGPDITSTASIYLGPSSDQESLEIGLKTISIESKVRSKTLSGGSSGSLDKLVGENQWVKESKNGKGKFLEQSTIDQSETASNVLSQGKYEITMKTIETKAVGFAPKIIESNTEGQMNTDTQEFYILTPSTVNALIKAFSDPTNSPHAQVEQIENE